MVRMDRDPEWKSDSGFHFQVVEETGLLRRRNKLVGGVVWSFWRVLRFPFPPVWFIIQFLKY